MSWAYEKSRAGRDWQCPSFQSGEDFCINIPLRTKLLNVDTKIFPGFFKKNSHATRQASNVRSPLQPPLQGCNLKGVNIPNMNGCFFWRPMATTRKKQLWSWGARGIPRLILPFYWMAVFYEEPDWNEGHCQSLPALLFRTFRTLAHIRTEDAKYVAAIWITNWIKRSSAAICVSGTALWDACCPFAWQALGFENMMAVLRGPAMQLTCNTHATHSQHNTQHEHFSCKFSMNVRISRGWPRIRSWNANIRFWYRTRIVMENLQEKCSCCVLCWLCVACVLHVSCMAGPRNTAIMFSKPSACHAKGQHASQSAVPDTQNSSGTSFYPICNWDCCHDILHPLS